jgi:hypothetical protein
MKLIASLLATGSLVSLFWFDVVSNGKELCSSSVPFRTQLETTSQQQAAAIAKAKLCKLIHDFPA